MAVMTDIQKIERKMKRIRSGKDAKVRPGNPETFTRGCTVGDAIRQGDLYLVIEDSVPSDFVLVDDAEIHKQLVPGNTVGAKHCLDSLDGVEQWRPKTFDNDSTVGPVLILAQDRVVQHPTHGHVTLLSGTTVACFYQREFDAERRREMRARD